MIEMATEQLMTLYDAARSRPPGRNGRPTHLSTVYRWIKAGIRGVKLEAIPIGGSLYTSREALQRFSNLLLSRRDAASPILPATSSAARRKSSRRAERELDRLGF